MVRYSLETDRELFFLARQIVLNPAQNKAVFYNEEIGEKRAKSYVLQHAGTTRIDELLKRSPKGQQLLAKLKNIEWKKKEEVWWELSRKMAQAASGEVQCFGPERLSRSQPVSTHKCRHVQGVYANTIFEKVELPVLDNNPRVKNIYFNGRLID